MAEDKNDERLKKDLGVARQSRGFEDRPVTENRNVTDAERLEMFRMQMFNDALPDLPNIPGYHVCWLTTTNSRDPIHRRIQLGYQPIRADEVPGLEYASIKTGEWVGMVGVNEMVAFKLPEQLYQTYMREAHYEAPLREEQKLAEVADSLRERAEQDGGRIIEGEGMSDLRYAAPAPGDFL